MIARDGATRWHNGRTGGSTSAMFIQRELDAAVIVLADTGSEKVMPLAESLVRRAAGMSVDPMQIENRTEVEVAIDQMRRLEGRYPLLPNFVFQVDVVDNKLMVGVTGQPTHQVYALSPTEWFYKVVDAKLVFDVPDDGPATAVVLHQNGVQQRAPRQK